MKINKIKKEKEVFIYNQIKSQFKNYERNTPKDNVLPNITLNKSMKKISLISQASRSHSVKNFYYKRLKIGRAHV